MDAIYTITERENINFWNDQILMKELWVTVAEFIDNLKTLAKLYQTCKMFHHMFANNIWLSHVDYFAILKRISKESC